jgi:trehalose 6-phosphate synthase
MRVGFRFLLFLVPVILLSVFGSLNILERIEQKWVIGDLNRRSELIFNSVHDYLVESLDTERASKRVRVLTRLLNRISRDERIIGALVCSPSGALISKSSEVPVATNCSAVSSGETGKNGQLSFVKTGDQTFYEAIFTVAEEGQTLAYFIVLHDTSFMTQRHEVIQRYAVILLIFLSALYSLITLLVYRWSMGDTVKKIGTVFRGMVTGELSSVDRKLARGELSPLARDLTKVIRELRHAKTMARDSENALAWNPTRLRLEVQKLFGDSQLCVIANREPYVHNRKSGGKIEVLFPASGLVTAVEPIVRACSGLWIAHGSGSADRETADSSGKLLVPPGNPEYALKRVWLSKAEEQGYYYGFSNEGLWPLCHIAHARPHFDSEDWKYYKTVNERFADRFVEEKWEGRPIVLIQDYHFALLPKLIREKKPESIVSLFWHIPWPNPEAFGICPWRKEILTGMLGADLIGFHTQFHCNNFLDTVDRFLEARVDRENFSVTIQGHTCYVKPFAISVEWPARYSIPVEEFEKERAELLSELNLPPDIKFGIGVDRVDYTKGILERFLSIEKLMERHPEWIGKFTFVQIGAPSRTHIKRYQDLNSEVQELADRINWRFSQAEVPPITLKLSHHNAPELFRYYRAADVCFVSSLHDGMNLVAKEYIAAKENMKGVLVLSTFAGASRELLDAIQINPYDLDECAEAVHQALKMPVIEQSERMRRLRTTVEEKNVYAWAGAFLSETHRILQSKSPMVETHR